MGKRILFLGYSREQTDLISKLEKRNCIVQHKADKMTIAAEKYDLIVSYGYRHILSQADIDAFGAPVINMHISHLPYNRGAHPNFWAFYEDTPHGVTIHELDAGIDTGPIIFQRPVKFNADELSFAMTYARLVKEIELMFVENMDAILKGNWRAVRQQGGGTYHSTGDLPEDVNWAMDIKEYLSARKRPIPQGVWT